MTPTLSSRFPRLLAAGLAASLGCASALASVINFNEQSTTNVWTFPTGANLLATATPTPAAATTHEGSSADWLTLSDGLLGAADEKSRSVTPANGESVTFALDVASQPEGYNITSFDAYAAWGDSGRDNLDFTIEYSAVADPATFIHIATVSNHTTNPYIATHTSLTETTGFLATGVHSIRLNFANQENGFVGYREFILRAEPTSITTLNESNSTGLWTLPSGTNLLDGATATDPSEPAGANHGNGDITSSSWTTLTDGSVGSPGTQLQSVAPLNRTSVIFPLDTSVNFNGYNISSFDAYGAWGDSGRDNLDFAIRYSTVADPTTFIPLAAVTNHTTPPLNATHTRLTPSSGYLATGVAAIQIYFNNQENGYVGYREFILLGSAVSLTDPLTWTGGSGTGGNADWTTTPDSNWQITTTGDPTSYSMIAPLTFDNTGTNTNINIPVALTAAAMTFSNDNTKPYVFDGALLTVSNEVVLAGSGTAWFNNQLQADSLTITGSGGVTLAADNPLTGVISMSDGFLDVRSNGALGTSPLVMGGGTAYFSSAAPTLASLGGLAGTIFLGDAATSADTVLTVGNASVTVFFGSIGDVSDSANGSLVKTGTGTLTLSGINTYTGTTTVAEGQLALGQRSALYNGNTVDWTASNIVVQPGATLDFRVGGGGEFVDSDIAALDTGGFAAGSAIGFDTTSGDFEFTGALTGQAGLYKTGNNVLKLSGGNIYTGVTTIIQGTLEAANPGGISIPGDLVMGNASFDAFVNMAANDQFSAGSVLTFANGSGAPNAKLQLRGTNQTVAGLESTMNDRLSIVQNDETSAPGYIGNPGPATLTLNATSDHSFHGIIRDRDGEALSIVKNGTGTQEFINAAVQGYGYTGGTTINEGTLKLNFDDLRPTSWNSNIHIASSGATLELAGKWNIFRTISGPGQLVKTGPGQISVCNIDGDANANTYSGGTVIREGTLKFYATNGSTGEGNVPGEFCPAGPMDPSNVIQVKPGATLGVGAIACFGESWLLPEHGVTINIEPGGRLWGADGDNIAFVPNIHLDGATVEVTSGSNVGGFNTNMTFVGTVVVGGTSNLASRIFNGDGFTGPNANISLGSAGLPGTVFQVDDVTLSSDPDLVVSSPLRNVGSAVSPLTKTGAGTMLLQGTNSYSGLTHVVEGQLQIASPTLVDTADVSIDATGTLALLYTATDTINRLTLDGVAMDVGFYGSTTNTTPGIIQTPRITGNGVLYVTAGPITDPYLLWADAIADVNQRGKTDDPDQDGFTNIEEFLFGTSPVAANGSLIGIEATGAGLVVRWNQRAAGTSTYVLQESTTLVDDPWATSTAPITDNPVQDLPDYVRKQATLPIDVPRKFVRVEATE